MAGCGETNKLFCFPCVLFGSEDKPWSKTGYGDLKHLSERAKKHENSAVHISCFTELCVLGTANIATALDSAYRKSISEHNEKVHHNRYILKRIINCIKFCGKLELSMRGHDETEQSLNRGVFLELIDFTSELDTIFEKHLDHAKTFKGTSKTVQNEILDSMLAVCQDEIKEQIEQNDFLAIQCDETTDVSNHCQMVIIVRYFFNDVLNERFWT